MAKFKENWMVINYNPYIIIYREFISERTIRIGTCFRLESIIELLYFMS